MNKLKNIKNFKLRPEKNVIIDNNDIVNVNNKTIKIEDAYFIHSYEDIVIIVDHFYNKGFLINEDYSISNFLNHKLFVDNVFGNYVVLYDDDYSLVIYDLSIDKIILRKKHKKGRVFIYKNIINILQGKSINFVDINTGNVIWQYSIDDFPNYIDISGNRNKDEISQIIGAYKNLLWFYLESNTLIAIDIEKGDLIHTIKDIEKGSGDLFLDNKKGVVKILAGHYYREFDLNTLKIIEKYKNEKLFFRSSNFYQEDDNLYFCGISNYPINTGYNCFGIFNTVTNQVSWMKEKQDDWGAFYNPPQANSKQLAILDDEGNLLIFEKE